MVAKMLRVFLPLVEGVQAAEQKTMGVQVAVEALVQVAVQAVVAAAGLLHQTKVETGAMAVTEALAAVAAVAVAAVKMTTFLVVMIMVAEQVEV